MNQDLATYYKDRVKEYDKVYLIPEQGNTYQTRNLENGTPHLVLKNFPTRAFLLQKLATIATEINYTNLEHYWIVACKIKINDYE